MTLTAEVENQVNPLCTLTGKNPSQLIADLIWKLEQLPKPDPFEEWWKTHRTLGSTAKDEANTKAGWDAAIKWKEGQS